MSYGDYLKRRWSPQGRAARAHQAPSAFTEAAQQLRAVSLEHQEGQYRIFRRATGALLHSHECKVEVVRRAERDGWLLGVR